MLLENPTYEARQQAIGGTSANHWFVAGFHGHSWKVDILERALSGQLFYLRSTRLRFNLATIFGKCHKESLK